MSAVDGELISGHPSLPMLRDCIFGLRSAMATIFTERTSQSIFNRPPCLQPQTKRPMIDSNFFSPCFLIQRDAVESQKHIIAAVA